MQDYNATVYISILVVWAILSFNAVRLAIFSKQKHKPIEKIVHSDEVYVLNED